MEVNAVEPITPDTENVDTSSFSDLLMLYFNLSMEEKSRERELLSFEQQRVELDADFQEDDAIGGR